MASDQFLRRGACWLDGIEQSEILADDQAVVLDVDVAVDGRLAQDAVPDLAKHRQ